MTLQDFSHYLKDLEQHIRHQMEHDLPLKAGNLALRRFKENFQKEGFFSKRWKEVKRRQNPKTRGAARTALPRRVPPTGVAMKNSFELSYKKQQRIVIFCFLLIPVLLALVFGILPIIKYDSQSALNNFKEYNMIDPGGLERYFGFTEDEVRSLCDSSDMDFDEIKRWYDGYKVGDIGGIFNPNSVMEAVSRRKCNLYWRTTGAGDELKPYLRNEMRDDVEKLLNKEGIPVDTTSFDNMIKDVDTRDKVFTVLIHLGYLSYDGQEASIPNYELMMYFASCIKNADLGGLSKVLSRSEDVLRCIRYNDEERLSLLMGLSHDDVCGAMEYNKEQLLYTTLRESLFFAHRDYIFHREYPTGKGFADLVLIPFPGRDLPAIILELKWDKSAEGPISQIKERNYPEKLFDYTGEVKLVGINYDKGTKVHECTIETFSRR